MLLWIQLWKQDCESVFRKLHFPIGPMTILVLHQAVPPHILQQNCAHVVRKASTVVTNLNDVRRNFCLHSQRPHAFFLTAASQCFQFARVAKFPASLSLYSCVAIRAGFKPIWPFSSNRAPWQKGPHATPTKQRQLTLSIDAACVVPARGPVIFLVFWETKPVLKFFTTVSQNTV